MASSRVARLRQSGIWALQMVYSTSNITTIKSMSVAKQEEPRPNPNIRVLMPKWVYYERGGQFCRTGFIKSSYEGLAEKVKIHSPCTLKTHPGSAVDMSFLVGSSNQILAEAGHDSTELNAVAL